MIEPSVVQWLQLRSCHRFIVDVKHRDDVTLITVHEAKRDRLAENRAEGIRRAWKRCA